MNKRWRKKLICPYCEVKHFRRQNEPKNYCSEKDCCKECEQEEVNMRRQMLEDYYR